MPICETCHTWVKEKCEKCPVCKCFFPKAEEVVETVKETPPPAKKSKDKKG